MHTSAFYSLRGLIVSAIFGAMATGFSAACVADPGLPGQIAKFGDLNTSTSAGASVLYDRILAAARGACSYYWFKTDEDEARCIHNAVANAVSKLNRPALLAIYNAKNPTPRQPLTSQNR